MNPSTGQSIAQWAQVGTTLLLGIVGFYIANSYRRQVKVKLAEKLLEAYSDLWSITDVSFVNSAEPVLMSRTQMADLTERMGQWYFDDGNGILMSNASRIVFFVAYNNMRFHHSQAEPAILRARLNALSGETAEQALSCACSRQLSRLRSQMKSDLGVYQGSRHLRDSRREDRQLFAMAGVRIGPPRWTRHGDQGCYCGHCEPHFTISNILKRRVRILR